MIHMIELEPKFKTWMKNYINNAEKVKGVKYKIKYIWPNMKSFCSNKKTSRMPKNRWKRERMPINRWENDNVS